MYVNVHVHNRFVIYIYIVYVHRCMYTHAHTHTFADRLIYARFSCDYVCEAYVYVCADAYACAQ